MSEEQYVKRINLILFIIPACLIFHNIFQNTFTFIVSAIFLVLMSLAIPFMLKDVIKVASKKGFTNVFVTKETSIPINAHMMLEIGFFFFTMLVFINQGIFSGFLEFMIKACFVYFNFAVLLLLMNMRLNDKDEPESETKP